MVNKKSGQSKNNSWLHALSVQWSASIVMTIVSATLSAGCSWPAVNGNGRTHLVFGFGLVTTADDTTQNDVGNGLIGRTQRVEATGVFASLVPGMAGLQVGQLKRQSVEIAPDAEVILEAKTCTSGEFHVSAWRPELPGLANKQVKSASNGDSLP